MKIKERNISVLLAFQILVFISSFSLKAQQNTLTTGGFETLNLNTIEFSVGQIFFYHYYSDSIVEEQGLQHSEVKNTVGFGNISKKGFKVSPNPFSNQIEVFSDELDNSKVEFELFSLNGFLIYRGELDLFISRVISFENLNISSGPYFIKILSNKTNYHVFNLIKL